MSSELAQAQALVAANPSGAIAAFDALRTKTTGSSDDDLVIIEKSIVHLGALYKTQKKPAELAALIKSSLPVLTNISKAKTAKIGTEAF